MKTIATIVLAAVIFCGFGMINNVADGGVIMVTETFTPTVEIVTPTIEEPTSTGGGSGGSGGGITL
ncbi:hypothetical protein HN588_00750, partial [Candidatus Bathyarchaeota archaeon]|nr:hypothetical protein [Candidatus Bathyarchaeota archaeon]